MQRTQHQAQQVAGQTKVQRAAGRGLLTILLVGICVTACKGKGAGEKEFDEDLHCPSPAIAQFESWGKSGSQQNCKIQHGPFVAWESGYVHVRGQYDMGEKVGVWRWYDAKGNVVKEINYTNKQ